MNGLFDLRLACRLTHTCTFETTGDSMSLMRAEMIVHAEREHGWPWPDGGDLAILPNADRTMFEAVEIPRKKRICRTANAPGLD